MKTKKTHNPLRCPACGRMKKRSNPANARYWLLLHVVSEKLKPQGQVFSTDAWHEWFKRKFLGADEVRMPSGRSITIAKSSADLGIDEFNQYMTQVEVWAAEHDVYLDEEMV